MPAAASLISLIFEQAFNQGDLDVVDYLVAADAATHLTNWGVPASRLGLKQMIANLRSAFPDLHCTVEDEISEGDKLAARWTMRGTHLGSYLGNRPTQRSIAVRAFFFARIEDSWIVENWVMIEELRILQQLGLVPPL